MQNFLRTQAGGVLASMITRLFDIPPDRVGVAFIDKYKNTIWLTNEQELQGSVVSTIRESRFGTRVFKILFFKI